MVGRLFAVAVESDQRFANEFSFQIVFGGQLSVVCFVGFLVFHKFLGLRHQLMAPSSLIAKCFPQSLDRLSLYSESGSRYEMIAKCVDLSGVMK